MSVGIDYLRITVFAGFDEVLSVVEREILEPAGALDQVWSPKGPVQRWERLEVLGADLIQLKAPKSSQVPYVVVEMKGDGCSAYQDQLHPFMVAVDGLWRWNGKRLDARWDHHALSPGLIDSTVRAGHFVSRSLHVGDRDWRDNEQGQTAYLGTREKPRHVRWYNKRGFNRMELEMADEWAADLLRKFVADGPEAFAVHALGYLLSTVDFREVGAVTRDHRAPRLAWWSHFVGQAEKVKNLTKTGEKIASGVLPIGAADDWVKRNRRSILRLTAALGPEWIIKRARYWARQRHEMGLMGEELLSEEDRAAVEALRRYRGSGLCGTDHEDLPF